MSKNKPNELETKLAVADEKFNNMLNVIRGVKKSFLMVLLIIL
jgi:hypothetical protein